MNTPTAEYYHILDHDAMSSVMATPLVKPGMVTIASSRWSEDTHIHLLPLDAMTLASMTLDAAREADPDGFEALWGAFKESLRKSFGPHA